MYSKVALALVPDLLQNTAVAIVYMGQSIAVILVAEVHLTSTRALLNAFLRRAVCGKPNAVSFPSLRNERLIACGVIQKACLKSAFSKEQALAISHSVFMTVAHTLHLTLCNEGRKHSS